MDTATPRTGSLDLDAPYVGYFDHYGAGWQAALVFVRGDGSRVAGRLGDEVSRERAEQMCQTLGEQTGVQVAGELDKKTFLPVIR